MNTYETNQTNELAGDNMILETSKLIASAMKEAAGQVKDATLIVLREIRTKESLKRDEITVADQYGWLKKAAKEREDSMNTYVNAGRADLATKEATELNVIKNYLTYLEAYMPKKMSEAEIKDVIFDQKFTNIGDCMKYFAVNKLVCDKRQVSDIFRSLQQ